MSFITPTPLPTITTLARAGALARAEALYADGGYDAQTRDPAALAVKGRLLKDRALLAEGAERVRLLKDAAAAYAAADAIAAAPYLLINVATLTLLAGDAKRASDVAAVVLERLARKGVAETPYWLAATRAEARLLRGTVPGAREALADAVKLDPEGWSDHASTLRQLGLILDAQGLAKDWLDPFRPPRSLHYAGHLGVAEDDPDGLRAAVDALLEKEAIGFGYGALAAGADMIVAEALIARGAKLHVVLPTTEQAFIDQSVTPYGPGWLPRFRACLKAAASLKEATRVAGAYEPGAAALASDISMGSALLNARLLESEGVQLLIADEGEGPYGDGAYTARDGKAWAASGSRQHILRAARSNGVPASAWTKEGRVDRRLAALLHVRVDDVEALDDWAYAHVFDTVLGPWWAAMTALAGGGVHRERWGNAWLFAFDDVGAASDFALKLRALDPPKGFVPAVTGHYGLIHEQDGAMSGAGVSALIDVTQSALPGTVTLSEPFATALALARGAAVRTEPIGSHALPGTHGETNLYGLWPATA